MRISDWSSDVCSSDLLPRHRQPEDLRPLVRRGRPPRPVHRAREGRRGDLHPDGRALTPGAFSAKAATAFAVRKRDNTRRWSLGFDSIGTEALSARRKPGMSRKGIADTV